jgi:hypothetical protein
MFVNNVQTPVGIMELDVFHLTPCVQEMILVMEIVSHAILDIFWLEEDVH